MGVDSKGNSLKQPMHPFHLAYGIGLKGSVARVRNKTPKHTKSLTGPSGRTLSSKFPTTGESDIGDMAEWPAVPSVTNLYARLLQKPSIIDDIGAVKHIFKAPLNLPESEEIVIDESSFEDINPHLTIYRSLTVDLASKEAAGRCLVGMIISRLAFAIQKIESQFELKVDYEYGLVATGKSEPDYASDVAILFIEVSTDFISLLLSIDQFFFPPEREGEEKTDSTL